MENASYPKNELQKAHRNRADGNSVICHTVICGGLLSGITDMQRWVMVEILFMLVQRRIWSLPLHLFSGQGQRTGLSLLRTMLSPFLENLNNRLSSIIMM